MIPKLVSGRAESIGILLPSGVGETNCPLCVTRPTGSSQDTPQLVAHRQSGDDLDVITQLNTCCTYLEVVLVAANNLQAIRCRVYHVTETTPSMTTYSLQLPPCTALAKVHGEHPVQVHRRFI